MAIYSMYYCMGLVKTMNDFFSLVESILEKELALWVEMNTIEKKAEVF